MRLPDPFPTCAEVAKRICAGYPTPTVWSRPRIVDRTGTEAVTRGLWNSNKPLQEIWGDGTYIANSDFGRDSAIKSVEKEGGRKTHYTYGPEGYANYPFAL